MVVPRIRLIVNIADTYMCTYMCSILYLSFSSDVHSLQQTCGKFPNNPEATITALDLPTHVLMKNLPSSTRDSAVRYYAENLGAEVERVHLLLSNQAVVQFNSYNSEWVGSI